MSSFYTSVIQRGDNLLIRSVEDGVRKQYKKKYKPYLFLKSQEKEAEYQTVFGEPADRMDFDSIRDAKDFIEKYSDVDNFNFYGMTQFAYPYMNDRWPGEIQYDRDLVKVVSLDIETESDKGFPDPEKAEQEVVAVTLSDTKKFIVLGCGDYKPHMKNVIYIKCKNETDLLNKLIKVWKKLDPDIITGWNTEMFDIPYIVNRIRRVLGEGVAEQLSPWGFIYDKDTFKNGVRGKTYDIVGIAHMDYMEVYKKWTFTMQESYKLDNIAKVELGIQKLDYSEYGSLHNLYVQNFQLFIEYNIRDTDLINKLDEKLKLLDLVLALSYDAKINYVDAYTTVRMWDIIIHNYLIEKKIVIPQYTPDDKSFQFVGGYVKEPQIGEHEWVVSFDLNSLYPHLIMQYNISPEKYRGKISPDDAPYGVDSVLNGSYEALSGLMSAKNVTVTPNGCMYEKDGQGFLAALMEQKYVDRSRFKKMMLSEEQKFEETEDPEHKKLSVRYGMIQMAKKIQLNAAYGALGNKYFRWFNPDYAESVTTGGQLSIRWVEKTMNDYLNKTLKTDGVDYVIAADTDSIYIRMKPLVDMVASGADTQKVVKILDKICKEKIEPLMDQTYQELADYMNAFAQKMVMKREVIADKGIWTAKKRYILNVWNSEGVQYNEPHLKIMGIEAVRSSTPNACREKIKESLKVIMQGSEEELQKFIKKFREEFVDLPFESIAFPRGVNGLSKYKEGKRWKSGTPIHVKGALVYNSLIETKEVEMKYDKIRSGDKIKFCYLKNPNPTGANVISCPDDLPKEFELHDFVDAEAQFDKAFLAPLKSITDVIGWETKKKSNLKGLFA